MQAALDAFQDRARRPILASHTAGMSAFRKEIVIVAPVSDGLADQVLTASIAFPGVDNVEAGIERTFQQASDGFLGRSFKTNLGAAKTKDRYLHVGVSKLALFH